MKKQLKVACAAVLSLCLLGSLTACSGSSSDTSSTTDTSTTTDATTDSATTDSAATAPEGAITAKLGHVGAPDHIFEVGALKYQELVSEATDGGIFIQTYPGSQLGADRDLMEALQLGTVEFSIQGTFDNFVPVLSAICLPFMYQSYAAADAFLDSDLAAELYAELESMNVITLAHMQNGFRFITSNKPIEKVADLQGLKIRTPETPLYVQTFEALGASPTPISFNELYSSLQQGVVEAQENPTAHIVTQRFYEVQSCVAKSNHIYAEAPLVVSSLFFNELDADTQQILRDKAYEATLYQREVSRDREEEDLKFLEEQGMTITEIDYDEFYAATQSVRDNWAAEYGQDLYDQIKAICDEAEAAAAADTTSTDAAATEDAAADTTTEDAAA